MSARDLERLARRAAGGDLEAAKRLLAEVMARSPAISEEEQGIYAVTSVCDGQSEVLSAHFERQSAVAAAAGLAAKKVRLIRSRRHHPEPPAYAEFDSAIKSGDFGEAIGLWNDQLNLALGTRERVWFWVEGPVPLRP